MRRLFGFALYAAGGLLLSFAVGRYVSGWYRADRARESWQAAEAQVAVMHARNVADRLGGPTVLASGAPVAQLLIPRIHLDAIVLEGVGDDELNAGPGHLPGSALPGEAGNSIISAHRDRHFDHLDLVQVGDTIVTQSGRDHLKWIVIARRVVDKATPVLFHTAEPTLTLTTCWPIRYLGPAPERLVVTARPVSASRLSS